MSVMIITMLFIGYFMKGMPAQVYNLHKSTGILLLGLFCIRLLMRVKGKYPELPEKTPKIIQIVAKANVIGLYLAMFIMPLSGFLMSALAGHSVPFYGLFEISSFATYKPLAYTFHQIHKICPIIFIVLIVAHIAGGLFHHFILKDNVLRRML
jgi:cytochrome b561